MFVEKKRKRPRQKLLTVFKKTVYNDYLGLITLYGQHVLGVGYSIGRLCAVTHKNGAQVRKKDCYGDIASKMYSGM